MIAYEVHSAGSARTRPTFIVQSDLSFAIAVLAMAEPVIKSLSIIFTTAARDQLRPEAEARLTPSHHGTETSTVGKLVRPPSGHDRRWGERVLALDLVHGH